MAERINLTGQKIGRWAVGEKTRVYEGKWRSAYHCVCDCGTARIVKQDNLVGGKSKSCGCLTREVNSAMRAVILDLVGQQFGKWTVVERACGDGDGKRHAWMCKCDCGTERVVLQDALLKGTSQSCGCRLRGISKEIHTKHADCYSRLYDIWPGMKTRCDNRAAESYANYGARGICVCDEWHDDYVAFRDWSIANGYSDSLTIDRIDVNGDYSPENCRWSDRMTQCNNKRNNLNIEWRGETHTLAEWCRMLDLPYKRTHARYRYYGWDLDTLFTTT